MNIWDWFVENPCRTGRLLQHNFIIERLLFNCEMNSSENMALHGFGYGQLGHMAILATHLHFCRCNYDYTHFRVQLWNNDELLFGRTYSIRDYNLGPFLRFVTAFPHLDRGPNDPEHDLSVLRYHMGQLSTPKDLYGIPSLSWKKVGF